MVEDWRSVDGLSTDDDPFTVTWDPADGPLHLKLNGLKAIVRFPRTPEQAKTDAELEHMIAELTKRKPTQSVPAVPGAELFMASLADRVFSPRKLGPRVPGADTEHRRLGG
jgi:hypothetical protein